MRPIPIPQFVAENEEEQKEWEIAQEIRNNMLKNKGR